MLKRSIAGVLTLILALTLAAPAAAAGGGTIYELFWCESPEEMQETYGITAEQYHQLSELADGFDADAYYIQAYGPDTYLPTPEDYMDFRDIDRETFETEMLMEYLLTEIGDMQAQEIIRQGLEAAGGVPGEVNVMLNGRCIPFPDAMPELVGGRTMVPLRAVMEAMGAQVSWQSGNTAVCTLGDTSLSFQVGEDVCQVTENGETTSLDLGVATYLKDGRTYVPVRFFAQAMGYDVEWDADYRTAVLVDRQALIDQWDSQFTVLNSFLAAHQEVYANSQAVEGDISAQVTLTMLDSISGDQRYAFSGTLIALASQDAVNLSGGLDLSALAGLLEEQGLTQEEAGELAGLLGAITFSLVASQEGAFLALPGLGELTGGEDDWMWQEVEDWSAIQAVLPGHGVTATVGQLIYESSYSTMAYYYPFGLWDALEEAGAQAIALAGDGSFTASGASYAWRLDREDLEALELSTGGDGTASLAFDQLDITAVLSPSGSYQLELTVALNDGYGSGPTTVKVTADASGTANGGRADLLVQLRNLADLEMEVRWTLNSTTQTPVTHPEGEIIQGELS